jgi:hypothetical protein
VSRQKTETGGDACESHRDQDEGEREEGEGFVAELLLDCSSKRQFELSDGSVSSLFGKVRMLAVAAVICWS